MSQFYIGPTEIFSRRVPLIRAFSLSLALCTYTFSGVSFVIQYNLVTKIALRSSPAQLGRTNLIRLPRTQPCSEYRYQVTACIDIPSSVKRVTQTLDLAGLTGSIDHLLARPSCQGGNKWRPRQDTTPGFNARINHQDSVRSSAVGISPLRDSLELLGGDRERQGKYIYILRYRY